MAGYEQEGAQRAGHIPGAASVPWAQAVQEDGTFKSADELRELYSGKGVLDGNPIIAYCRIGERSAHTWFVLHELLGQRRREELRRLVDRVGQHGRRADREGRVAAGYARSAAAGRPLEHGRSARAATARSVRSLPRSGVPSTV